MVSMNSRALCNDFLDISLRVLRNLCIFISNRGINTILEFAKVSQTATTRSRHVSRSGSFDFNLFSIVYSLTRVGDVELPLCASSCLTA